MNRQIVQFLDFLKPSVKKSCLLHFLFVIDGDKCLMESFFLEAREGTWPIFKTGENRRNGRNESGSYPMACSKNYTLSLAKEPVHLTRLLVTFGSKINTVNAVINIG